MFFTLLFTVWLLGGAKSEKYAIVKGKKNWPHADCRANDRQNHEGLKKTLKLVFFCRPLDIKKNGNYSADSRRYV